MSASTEVLHPLTAPRRATRHLFIQTPSDGVLSVKVDGGMLVSSLAASMASVVGGRAELTCAGTALARDAPCEEQTADCSLLVVVKSPERLKRSSSSPSLSPGKSGVAGGLEPEAREEAFEAVGKAAKSRNTRKLLEACHAGLLAGHAPKLEPEGLGGTYLLRGCGGERLAMFKPLDEEPWAVNNPKGYVSKPQGSGLSARSVRAGEAAFREVAASLLDHERWSRVPRTALVRVSHPLARFYSAGQGASAALPKLGSLQAFVRHDYDASEHGTSRFPVTQVHRLGVLDVRLYNTDRHTGNILVCRRSPNAGAGSAAQPLTPAASSGRLGDAWSAPGALSAALEGDRVELVPIDHGYCLPESLEAVYFEWLHWPQASMPFSRDTLAYIARLDGAADAQLLAKELPALRPSARRLLQLTTLTLQLSAAAGLCLADIGSLLSRPVVRIGEEPSTLERMVGAALEALEQQSRGVGAGVGAHAHATPSESAQASVSGAGACDSDDGGCGGAGWGEECTLGELSEGDEEGAQARVSVSRLRASGEGSLQFQLDEQGCERKASAAVPVPVPPRRASSLPLRAADSYADGADGADGSASASASSSVVSSTSASSYGGASPGPGAAARSPLGVPHARPRPPPPSARGPGGLCGALTRSAPKGALGFAPPAAQSTPQAGLLGQPPSPPPSLLGRSLGRPASAGAGARRGSAGTAAAAAAAPAAAPSHQPSSPARVAPGSFADVPACSWRAFLALFTLQLQAVLQAHPARRGQDGAPAAQRATQLVTSGGTRVEAFGTSCPGVWLDRHAWRRQGSGGGAGW